MIVKISEYELTCKCPHKLYEVMLDDVEIETAVPHDPGWVSAWIKKIEILNESRLHRLIVGLDIEWKPNFNSSAVAAQNPVATIQLCVGNSASSTKFFTPPKSPAGCNFLQNDDYRFVGAGIKSDVKKLWDDYGLDVLNTVDLREWAAMELDNKELLKAGLKELVKEIVEKEIVKPKNVTMSDWDQRRLSPKQICYACLDAYLSFENGTILSAWY